MQPDIDKVLMLTKMIAHDYPVKTLSSDIQKNRETLYAELNETGSAKLGIRTWAKILEKTGDLSPLDELEAGFNRAAFKLTTNGVPVRDVFKIAMSATKEFGDVMGAFREALENDDDLSIKDKELIIRQVFEAIQALATFAEAVKKA